MKNEAAKFMGNYARHAQFWDWGGHSRTQEHEYWYKYATKYGSNVLIPMCAWGETGVYMAERGMDVTAFDITPEMVAEGRKRFGELPGLRLYEGDIRDFCFDVPAIDFCYCMDFGHLHLLDDVKKALLCIGRHLRAGGCLVIETGLRMPDAESRYTPAQTWYPASQVSPHFIVWKTGESFYDADTGRHYIFQKFYAQDENDVVESFDHEFYLQGYYREEWLAALKECGFKVVGEYSNREGGQSWQSGGSGFRMFEVVKLLKEDARND